MLKKLIVRDFALIENMELDFGNGMTAITGETGSGKSLILDALTSVLGGRCNTMNIRTGSKSYRVEAVLDVSENPRAKDWLLLHGYSAENGEIIIKKELSSDGKSRSQIGGSLAPLQHLRELGSFVSEIHSQNDQLYLLDKDTQLEILDEFASLSAMKNEVKESFVTYKTIRKRVEELRKSEEEKSKKTEDLRFKIQEIKLAKLKDGEEETLSKEEFLLVNGEKLAENFGLISYYMNEGEECILKAFPKILNSAEKIFSIHPEFGSKKEELIEVYTRLKEIASDISDEKDEIFFSPERLESVQKRLDEIAKLKKKYGKSVAEILESLSQFESELETVLSGSEILASLNADLMNACGHLSHSAVKLSQMRRSAIVKFETEIQREFSFLGLKDAKLQIVLRWEATPDGDVTESGKRYMVSEDGLDQIDFYFSANQGEKPRPLRKIASGGEISRVMLALKSILGKNNFGKLMIFDEIDSGIGGEIAHAVADKLKSISENFQVLLITHLQQIAAVSKEHLKVEKESSNGRTVSTAAFVSKNRRAEELAKMISGSHVTKGAMDHARELLQRKSA